MDKGAIKKFAVWARRELIDRVSQRAQLYGITETDMVDRGAESIQGRLLSAAEKSQRDALVAWVKRDGYQQVIEEVAYTWFNRFCALRFMEVNGYLPSMVRVFTDDSGAFKPQILAEAIHLELDGLDREKVFALKETNQDDELYKYLLIAQCNALGKVLPGLFEKIGDPAELLFPDHLLREGSVAEQMVAMIPEEDWRDAVQIIGWLYQYYNTEPKDEVFANLKKNIKVSKENIPAATQLFTPDWIVRYMVENSLGRLYIDWRKNEGVFADGRDPDEMTWHEIEGKRIANEEYIAKEMGWKYFLPEAEQEPEVRKQLDALQNSTSPFNPEDIKVIDPCMGSGHILAYMFDVLVQIYTAFGYSTRDAVKNIVSKNLYGLDIDERATQLAYFSVMMKARQYDANFLSRELQPQVYCTKGDEEGEEYGSLLVCDDPGPMPEQLDLLGGNMDSWHYRKLLSQKYDVVVTNPPYMGQSGMSSNLNDFVKLNYPAGKMDLYGCFIEATKRLTNRCGYFALITMHSWMFLTTFQMLRDIILERDTVSTVHLGARAFEDIGGEVVQTVSFVIRNSFIPEYSSSYIRLIDETSQSSKEQAFLQRKRLYSVPSKRFKDIPGAPFAYWIPNHTIELFRDKPKLGELCISKTGMTTGDNGRFLRIWHEIIASKIHSKWFFYNKGGGYRKWYGSIENVIIWENDGEMVKNAKCSTIRNPGYYFKECISWNLITTDKISVRAMAPLFVMGDAGPACYINNDTDYYLYLALLNSKVSDYLLKIINPTINYSCGVMEVFPVCNDEIHSREGIVELSDGCVALSRKDWDAYETSWDFKRHPLI